MKFRIGNVSKAWGFFKLLRIFFIFSTIISVLITGIGLWNEHQQLEPILEEMGTVFNPLYTLSENSGELIQEGLFQYTGSFFKDIWQFFKNLYSILEPLVIVYIWMYYLFLICMHFIIGDNSRKLNSFICATIIFFFIQLLYIGVFTDLTLKTPFVAVKDLFKIVIALFS